MTRRFAAAVVIACITCVLDGPPASAMVPKRDLGGRMQADVDGKTVHFPSLKTDIIADVTGDLVAVTIVQTFVNPAMIPLNATYLFPLNEQAAVHAMEMQVGDELVVAEIRRREAARQTFEQGKREGKAAALLEQHRPNMFTQRVANLMPGLPIKVTLRYVQPVPRLDGAYQLVVPLVVGPRYVPPGPRPPIASAKIADADVHSPVRADAGQAAPSPAGEWTFGPVPAYPDVAGLTIPKHIDPDRVSFRVNLAAGVPVTSVASPTHAIAVTGEEHRRTISLAEGRIIDNRDFIIGYRIAGAAVQAGMQSHRDPSGGTLALMIEPPAQVAASDVTPREIVFVLDTSGSMSGYPIEASKLFMRHALTALQPSDYFRIIRFSSNAREFSSQPLPATPDNLARGLAFVQSLEADGGTEVVPALSLAFAKRPPAGTHRLLVFLSDGYVGNEAEILRMVAENIGQARTYVFGIGTAVNRYLLGEMAHLGRGLARIFDPTEKSEDAAIAFANKLSTTVMTDLSIDWGDVKVTDVVPAVLPDLFAGDALRIHARFQTSGTFMLRVKGRVNGREATLPVRVELPAEHSGEQTRAIPLTWARAEIAEQMRRLMMPLHARPGRSSDAEIEERVTGLGLAHSLVTHWTSFVAVSKQVVNTDPAASLDAQVPLPIVEGVGPQAYGRSAVNGPGPQAPLLVPIGSRGSAGGSGNSFGGQFSGGSTPEPEHLAGLLVVIVTLLAAVRRRQFA